jgi:hypothetical protein
MEIPRPAPRHAVAKTGLRVAVLPFGDARGRQDEPRSWWYFVPLVPFSTSLDERTGARDAGDPYHPRRQVARQLAEYLQATRIFGDVRYVDADWVDPAGTDLVITGDIRRGTRQELRTLYGLTLAGLPLWLLGAPIGWNGVEWGIDIELRDPGNKRSLKAVSVDREWKAWTGLYWGARGYADDESEALASVLADLAAEIDTALDEVPALAARTARPVLPSQPRPVRARAARVGKAFVLGDQDSTSEPIVELFAEELTRQSRGTVIGMSDVELMIDWQERGDLVGCDAPSCLAEIGSALAVDTVFHLRFSAIGDQQMLTVKLFVPATSRMLERRTWQARGTEPNVFAVQMPEIVAAAVETIVRRDR